MSADNPTAHDPLRSIAHQQARNVSGSSTLRELAAAMQENDCSALVITKHDGTHAVVTERDIVRALGNDSDPDDDWAVDVMSTHLRMLSGDDPIVAAAKLMRDEGIRHVCVADDTEELAMVSIRDLLQPFIASLES